MVGIRHCSQLQVVRIRFCSRMHSTPSTLEKSLAITKRKSSDEAYTSSHNSCSMNCEWWSSSYGTWQRNCNSSSFVASALRHFNAISSCSLLASSSPRASHRYARCCFDGRVLFFTPFKFAEQVHRNKVHRPPEKVGTSSEVLFLTPSSSQNK